jgi:hypothetical protein
MNNENSVQQQRGQPNVGRRNTRTQRRPLPLFVIGSDRDGYDPHLHVGTLAEVRRRYPAFNAVADPQAGVWFADLRFSLGFLINPESAEASELYVACTGETKAAPKAVYAWLADDASHLPHLSAALALIARRQGAIADDHLRQLLRELAAA